MKQQAEIGIIGGSGFYEFIKKGRQVEVRTPYGLPSDKVTITEIAGQRVAFLPRHGAKHQLAPHKIPNQANIWAMHKLGVRQIIGPCAAGSLQFNIKPGSFVICDQFVDRTWGRPDTFSDGSEPIHVQSVSTYCPELGKLAAQSCKKLKIPHHESGTVVVIQGPRFTSAAESAWFTRMGWQVVNMTQYPEAILAHELGMCYVNISLITDFDAGLVGSEDIPPVTPQEVFKVFNRNIGRLKKLIIEMLNHWPAKSACNCERAPAEAKLS